MYPDNYSLWQHVTDAPRVVEYGETSPGANETRMVSGKEDNLS